jgi:Glycine cleavage system T protein (aminomethyltransferase)
VLDRFEEWLQTEWPDLRVYCTSVTEQWAVVAINGPGGARSSRRRGPTSTSRARRSRS